MFLSADCLIYISVFKLSHKLFKVYTYEFSIVSVVVWLLRLLMGDSLERTVAMSVYLLVNSILSSANCRVKMIPFSSTSLKTTCLMDESKICRTQAELQHILRSNCRNFVAMATKVGRG